MIDKLEALKKRYEEVEGELSKPETVSDLKIFKKLNKEYKSLGKIVEKFESYKSTLVGVEEAKEIIDNEKDEEFREIAKKELETLNEKKHSEEEDLKQIFGIEAGSLLAAEAICEENFQQKNTKINEKMEPLDSENFDPREKREARNNAF